MWGREREDRQQLGDPMSSTRLRSRRRPPLVRPDHRERSCAGGNRRIDETASNLGASSTANVCGLFRTRTAYGEHVTTVPTEAVATVQVGACDTYNRAAMET